MYRFKEDINYQAHFWFDKKLFDNLEYARLPPSSKSIFPVIGSHTNREGEAFPGERRIAILSGLSDKIVRKGIKGLEDFPGFKVEPYLTRSGRWSKRFYIEPPPNEPGRSFPFYKCVLDGGNWRQLKPTAQALYPVMRRWGKFNLELYFETDGFHDERNYGAFDEIYADRKCDYCDELKNEMARYAGISTRSINEALDDLQKNFLIEPLYEYELEFYGWKVFLFPQEIYEREYLNNLVKESYKHEIRKKKIPVKSEKSTGNPGKKGDSNPKIVPGNKL